MPTQDQPTKGNEDGENSRVYGERGSKPNLIEKTPFYTSNEDGTPVMPQVLQRDFTMSINQRTTNNASRVINMRVVSSKDDESSKFMPTPNKESRYNSGLKSRIHNSASKPLVHSSIN